MAVLAASAVILVASWINTLFYMLEVLLVIKYFRRPNHPLWHKVGVGIFILADTACTFGICAQVYLILLVFPCTDLEGVFVNSLYWPISITSLSTYVTASVEQGFLCYLLYTVTKRRLITGFFAFTIFLHLGVSLAAVGVVIDERNAEGRADILMKIGAISCAVTDVLLAASLAFTVYGMESRVGKPRTIQSLLRRLGVLSLTSGVLAAFTTIAAVTTVMVGSVAFTLFFFVQGRVYAFTILANLLLGFPGKAAPTETNTLSRRTTTSRRLTTAGCRTSTNNASGEVFRLEYLESSDDNSSNRNPHPESLNLEPLSENVKTSPD
ncbi:hypothetical protein B0H13DRAFT_1123751 [Mycena leptocephala]|nr:hypothetical protein B0H13DRAFT_1123751 [Mycena leptocephala]